MTAQSRDSSQLGKTCFDVHSFVKARSLTMTVGLKDWNMKPSVLCIILILLKYCSAAIK